MTDEADVAEPLGAGSYDGRKGTMRARPDRGVRVEVRPVRRREWPDEDKLRIVRESLQPQGFIIASRGRVIAHSGSMAGGEPPMVKTGEVDTGAESVRWQVGTLTRGSRTFVYVSCVTGPVGLAQNAAAIVADHELRNAGVQ